MDDRREWHGNPGASEEAIALLVAAAPVRLPKGYLALLSESDGGEGPLPVQPFKIVLNSASEVVKDYQDGTFEEFFPGLFVVGSNGAGQGIAFDTNHGDPGPIVYFDMTNIDLSESIVLLVKDFDLLMGMIGLEGQ